MKNAKVFAQILGAGAIFICAGLNAERNSVDTTDVVKQSLTELNMEDGVSNAYLYGGAEDYCLLYPYAYGCGGGGGGYVDGGYYGGGYVGGYRYGRGGYHGGGYRHGGGYGGGGHRGGGFGGGGHRGGGFEGGGHRGGGHRR